MSHPAALVTALQHHVRDLRGRRDPGAGRIALLAMVALAAAVAVPAGGCGRLATSPAPPDVRAVLVLPVDNRTGSPLGAEPAALAGLFGREPSPVTAADLLARALRTALAQRGFAVALADPRRAITSPGDAAAFLATSAPDAVALYTQLRVWSGTSASHLVYVDVALDAWLVAPDGRVLWTARLPATPIDGGTASTVSLGYPEVARRVAELVTGTLHPAAGG